MIDIEIPNKHQEPTKIKVFRFGQVDTEFKSKNRHLELWGAASELKSISQELCYFNFENAVALALKYHWNFITFRVPQECPRNFSVGDWVLVDNTFTAEILELREYVAFVKLCNDLVNPCTRLYEYKRLTLKGDHFQDID